MEEDCAECWHHRNDSIHMFREEPMGYNFMVSGRIVGKPAPAPLVIPDSYGPEGDHEFYVEVSGEESTVGVVDGRVTVIEGDQFIVIEPRWNEEPYGATNANESLIEVLGVLQRQGVEKFRGAIYLAGEGDDDRSRLRVTSYSASGAPTITQERPEMIWPNGDRGWQLHPDA